MGRIPFTHRTHRRITPPPAASGAAGAAADTEDPDSWSGPTSESVH